MEQSVHVLRDKAGCGALRLATTSNSHPPQLLGLFASLSTARHAYGQGRDAAPTVRPRRLSGPSGSHDRRVLPGCSSDEGGPQVAVEASMEDFGPIPPHPTPAVGRPKIANGTQCPKRQAGSGVRLNPPPKAAVENWATPSSTRHSDITPSCRPLLRSVALKHLNGVQ